MRKNILWIMTDQQKYNALSCLGGPDQMSVNLDGLAKDGILFDNAYTPCPLCGPARASLKTGLYPPSTGLVKNWVKLKDDLNYLPQVLLESGYQTGMAGKLHFYPPLKEEYGFEVTHLSDAPYSVYSDDADHSEYVSWLRSVYHNRAVDPVEIFNADELSYDDDLERFIMGSGFRSEKEHETWWTEQCTLDFLEKRDKERPFFFYCSYFGPHQPYLAPTPYDNWLDPSSIQLPSSWHTDFKKDCPVFQLDGRSVMEHVKSSLDDDAAKRCIAAYFGQVKMIDESIGRILDYLKTNGLYDDTIIIFSSDHGDHLGEHGLFFKGQMYDSCAKVPLIVKLSGNAGGRVDHHVVNTIDLYATILELTKCGDGSGTESRSLVGLLNGEQNWSDESFSIIGGSRESAMTMLRSGNLKLIRYPIASGAVYEMYDLEVDCEENSNIWEIRKDEAQVVALKNRLDEWSLLQISRYDN